MQDEVTQSHSLLHNELPICYPFVKWAGGKTQLLAKLDSFIPAHFSKHDDGDDADIVSNVADANDIKEQQQRQKQQKRYHNEAQSILS